MEKLTQLCWFQLNRTISSQVMTVLNVVVGAQRVAYSALQCKNGRLGASFTNMGRSHRRSNTKTVLESVAQNKQLDMLHVRLYAKGGLWLRFFGIMS